MYWVSAASWNKHPTKEASEFHQLHQSKSTPANSRAITTLHFWLHAVYSQGCALHCKVAGMHNRISEWENDTSYGIFPEQTQSKKKNNLAVSILQIHKIFGCKNFGCKPSFSPGTGLLQRTPQMEFPPSLWVTSSSAALTQWISFFLKYSLNLNFVSCAASHIWNRNNSNCCCSKKLSPYLCQAQEASLGWKLHFVFSSRVASLLCYAQHLIYPAALKPEPLPSHLPSNSLLRLHCLPAPQLFTGFLPSFCGSQLQPSLPHLYQPFLLLPSQNGAQVRDKEQHVARRRGGLSSTD